MTDMQRAYYVMLRSVWAQRWFYTAARAFKEARKR